MKKDYRFWLVDTVLIFICAALLYLGFAFLRPLANPDEGRYAEIPREMIAGGDYVTPRLNGLPYFYKPPLFYWLQCASLKAFGINRTSVRLASSLMAVLGVCLTYAAARSLYGRRAGLFAAFILATTPLYCVIGLIVTLDMAVSVFMSGAMFAFIVAIKKSGIWRSVLIVAFFVFCSLAVMTKGIIGILIPCAVAFLYVVSGGIASIKNFFSIMGRREWLCVCLGILAFFAIAAPWHILAAIANPSAEGVPLLTKDETGQGFFWYYFIHEHFLRYIDPETSMRAQPFWFFLAIAPAGFLPWLFFLPRVAKNAVSGGAVDARDCRDSFKYMAIWVLFIVLFFSVSSSKLVPYITAVYPALAFIVGVWAARAWDNLGNFDAKAEKWIMVVLGFVAAIALVVAFFILKRKPIEDEVIFAGWFSAFGTFFVMAGISAAALAAALRGRLRLFWAITAAGVAALIASININAALAQRMSSEKIAAQIKAQRSGEPLAIAFDYGYFQDLPVWLGEVPMLVGEPPTEQYFGWQREKDRHSGRIFADAAQLRAFLEKNKKLWIVIKDRDIALLKEYNLPLEMREKARSKHIGVFEISLKDEKK